MFEFRPFAATVLTIFVESTHVGRFFVGSATTGATGSRKIVAHSDDANSAPPPRCGPARAVTPPGPRAQSPPYLLKAARCAFHSKEKPACLGPPEKPQKLGCGLVNFGSGAELQPLKTRRDHQALSLGYERGRARTMRSTSRASLPTMMRGLLAPTPATMMSAAFAAGRRSSFSL